MSSSIKETNEKETNEVVWAGWKLNSRVSLELNHDAVIRINTDGYLMAKGTATENVTFTGAIARPVSGKESSS